MRQAFIVELEWKAGDTPYSEGALLEQLRQVFGREYDNEIYSVREVKSDGHALTRNRAILKEAIRGNQD